MDGIGISDMLMVKHMNRVCSPKRDLTLHQRGSPISNGMHCFGISIHPGKKAA